MQPELAARERKRDKLDIIPLSRQAREKYADRWRTVQTAFVDNPSSAVGDADRLVTQVMRERGYPIDDFDQRAADISVDQPTVVENYRAAHSISLSQQQGDVGTEKQRQALEELNKDRAFLKTGGVFDDDFIDAYIDLKMGEVIRFEHTPHPVEFEMYYSA